MSLYAMAIVTSGFVIFITDALLFGHYAPLEEITTSPAARWVIEANIKQPTGGRIA
jgi:hypothetical protein